MNFREIENIENQAVSNETAAGSSFHLEILADYFAKEKRKSGAKENPFEYFYEDVISSSLSFNFKSVLGDAQFKNASEDALACLEICIDFSKLPIYSISGWLQNALKFIDHLVLHYIQEVLKETPIILGGEEKSRYIQIKRKKGEISDAGDKLIYLYELRSKQLEHRTRVFPDGRQEIISPPRKLIRKEIAKSFPDVLKIFLRTYKTTFPQS
jgi:hypothetical protein